jgi:Domain of unknown function (DUF4253)
VLLVPCNRPADALIALGHRPETTDAAELGSVLRSWEERFSAVPVELTPSTVTLAVGAPPTTADQALRLAAELHAIAPADDGAREGHLRDLASLLRVGGTDSGWRPSLRLAPELWELGLG